MPGGFKSKITAPGVIGSILLELEAAAQQPFVDMFSMPAPSDSLKETYAWLGQVPQMREWLGPRIVKQLNEFNFSVLNRQFESSILIPVADIDRDKTGQINIRISELVGRERSHWAKLISEAINDNVKGFDGSNLFATDHVWGGQTAQKNLLTSGEVASLNVVDPNFPTVNEAATIILDLIAAFGDFKDDEGEPINEDPMKFGIAVSKPSHFTAFRRAIGQNLISTGTGTIDNLVAGMDIEVYFNTRLTSNNNIHMAIGDRTVKAFIRQQEGPVNVMSQTAGSHTEWSEKAWSFGVDTWRAAAPGIWTKIIRATMS